MLRLPEKNQHIMKLWETNGTDSLPSDARARTLDLLHTPALSYSSSSPWKEADHQRVLGCLWVALFYTIRTLHHLGFLRCNNQNCTEWSKCGCTIVYQGVMILIIVFLILISLTIPNMKFAFFTATEVNFMWLSTKISILDYHNQFRFHQSMHGIITFCPRCLWLHLHWTSFETFTFPIHPVWGILLVISTNHAISLHPLIPDNLWISYLNNTGP